MKHTARAVALLATAVVGLAGCSAGDPASKDAEGSTGYPVTVEDCGDKVTLDTAPAKVLTIGTAAISLMDAAGASSLITARSGEFGAPLPQQLKNPPTNATIIDPNDPTAESIISSGIDVVYGYGLFNAAPDQLDSAGITLLTVQGECGHDASGAESDVDFSTVSNDIRRLGNVFGTSDVADGAADELDARVSKLSKDVATDAPKVAWLYYFSATDSLSAYGGSGMPAAVLEAAGLKNVFADQKESYLTISVESLLQADPDWIVLSYGIYGESSDDALSKLKSEAGLDQLHAIDHGHIITVAGTASEASPRAVEGLEEIVAGTHHHD